MTKNAIFLAMIASLILASCTKAVVRFEASIPKKINAQGRCDVSIDEMILYQHDEIISTTGLAIGCWITAIFYGGSCWAYYGLPYKEDIVQTRDRALDKIRILNRLPKDYDINACIVGERIYQVD